jgi:hypothetical protein
LANGNEGVDEPGEDAATSVETRLRWIQPSQPRCIGLNQCFSQSGAVYSSALPCERADSVLLLSDAVTRARDGAWRQGREVEVEAHRQAVDSGARRDSIVPGERCSAGERGRWRRDQLTSSQSHTLRQSALSYGTSVRSYEAEQSCGAQIRYGESESRSPATRDF